MQAKKTSLTLELTIVDRLSFPAILPKAGNILTMTKVQEIVRRIEITRDEAEAIGLQMNKQTGNITWDPELAKTKTIDFSDTDAYVINQGIEQVDRQGSVTVDMLDLIERIRKARI